MKLRYFSQALFALMISTFAISAEDADRSWQREHRYSISMDPLSWTSGNFRFGLEGSFNDRMSFYMPISFGVKSAIYNNGYFNGGYFAPKVGVKYYVTGKSAHQGFYLAPLLGLFIGKLDTSVNPVAHTTAALTYGFRSGFAWNIWRGLWLDSYLGWESFAVSFNSDQNNNGNAPAGGTSGFVPLNDTHTGGNFAAGIQVGYNW